MGTSSGRNAYLVHRGETYHFRYYVPVDLRVPLGKGEIRLSLGAIKRREARAKAHVMAMRLAILFEEIREQMSQDFDKTRALAILREEMKRILSQDFFNRIGNPKGYEFCTPLPDVIMEKAGDLIAPHLSGSEPPQEGNKPLISASTASSVFKKLMEWNEWPLLNTHVRGLLAKHGLECPSDYICNVLSYYHLMSLQCCSSAIQAREAGFLTCGIDLVDSLPELESVTSNVTQATQKGPKLTVVFEKYSEERVRGGQWKPRTRKQNEDIFRWLLDHFGDVPIQSITNDMMRSFKEMLLKAKARNAKKSEKTLDIKTVANIMVTLTAFFSYALDNRYITENPAQGLKIKVKKSKSKSYDKMTAEDLERIFNLKQLVGRTDAKPWMFWIPVLALFTGCRLEELAQLRYTDIRQENGVWFLDINENDDKSVKSESSKRRVPLHSFIVESLKFIEHVKLVNQKGHDRVFPELVKIDNRYGHGVSKWFGKLLERVGVKKPETKKVFHSLRHTFITCLQHKKVEPYLLASIAGHETDLITISTYGEEFKVEQKKEAIELLDFGVDLSHLAKCRFIPNDEG